MIKDKFEMTLSDLEIELKEIVTERLRIYGNVSDIELRLKYTWVEKNDVVITIEIKKNGELK